MRHPAYPTIPHIQTCPETCWLLSCPRPQGSHGLIFTLHQHVPIYRLAREGGPHPLLYCPLPYPFPPPYITPALTLPTLPSLYPPHFTPSLQLSFITLPTLPTLSTPFPCNPYTPPVHPFPHIPSPSASPHPLPQAEPLSPQTGYRGDPSTVPCPSSLHPLHTHYPELLDLSLSLFLKLSLVAPRLG